MNRQLSVKRSDVCLAVRKTLASILLLLFFTRPVKAVHVTQSFTRSVYVVCTLIEESKDNTVLFYLYNAGENKNKWHFCLSMSHVWASIVFHCLCEIIIQNWIRFYARGSFKISQPFRWTVSDRQIYRRREVLSENRISIVFVGVVNQQKLAGPFLTSGVNFSICYTST